MFVQPFLIADGNLYTFSRFGDLHVLNSRKTAFVYVDAAGDGSTLTSKDLYGLLPRAIAQVKALGLIAIVFSTPLNTGKGSKVWFYDQNMKSKYRLPMLSSSGNLAGMVEHNGHLLLTNPGSVEDGLYECVLPTTLSPASVYNRTEVKISPAKSTDSPQTRETLGHLVGSLPSPQLLCASSRLIIVDTIDQSFASVSADLQCDLLSLPANLLAVGQSERELIAAELSDGLLKIRSLSPGVHAELIAVPFETSIAFNNICSFEENIFVMTSKHEIYLRGQSEWFKIPVQ